MFRTVEVWLRSRAQVDENLHMNCLMLGEVRDVERLTIANWGGPSCCVVSPPTPSKSLQVTGVLAETVP